MTASVRAFYEAYPYPSGNSPVCDGYHGRLLLSYIEQPQGIPSRLRILEAGCGRGLNLTAVAAKETRDQFIGIDINRVAIEEAAATALAQGVSNLNFQVADLLDKTSLPEMGRGFDVILSYGVLHHLSDPLKGLQQITDCLAPHGVVGLMVDGSYGRQPLDRYLQALEIISPKAAAECDRPAYAQALARAADRGVFSGNCWQGTAYVDPVEFADRCLHVHEQSYDIDGLWDLLDAAGLKFIRWHELSDWSVEGITEDPDFASKLRALDSKQRFRVVERLAYRPKLALVAARKEQEPRKLAHRDALFAGRFALNPQLQTSKNEAGRGGWLLRGRPLPIEDEGQNEMLLSLVSATAADFTCREVLERLGDCELTQEQGLEWFLEMLHGEVFYALHEINPGIG